MGRSMVALTKGHPITRRLTRIVLEPIGSVGLLSPKGQGWQCGNQTSNRRHSSWSLPLALQLGVHLISWPVVTLTKAFSITRPAILLIFGPS